MREVVLAEAVCPVLGERLRSKKNRRPDQENPGGEFGRLAGAAATVVDRKRER